MSTEAFSAEPAARTHLPFSFNGTASEYFGIWIVNLLLSIVTLGIYTAWAKVRRLRYFYGNTFLDGHNFEYHARPKQILIGRIIVLGVLILFNVLANFAPLFAGILLIPYFAAIPWVINKAIRFNARMTSYRNIRFGFEGKYWSALGIFVAMPFAVLFTLGLLAPVGSRLVSNYIGNGMSYGTAGFATDAPLGNLYRNFGATILFVLGMSAIAALIGGLGVALFSAEGLLSMIEGVIPKDVGDALTYAAVIVAVVVFYTVSLFSYLFYRAGVRNIAYRATSVDEVHGFDSSLSRLRYFWIILSNFVLTICSIGLMRPWAAIRTWRYQADKTAFLAAGPLDGFVESSQMEGNVAAAEFLDIEGIDFGL